MIASSRLCRTVAFMLFAAVTAIAADVKIVANSSVRANSISLADLRSVFLLQRKTLKDGSLVEPVLGKSGVTTDVFMKRYMNRDLEEIHTYYQGLVFTGKGSMPRHFNSDAEVVAHVARTRGAIGYVDADASTEGVKVLAVTEDIPAPRALITRVEPDYPETLKRLQISGTVRLQAVISAKGAVESVSLLGGNPILGEAAILAVRQWIYSPAPARTVMEISLTFDPKR